MLKVEYLSPGELRPYSGNAKLHPAEQVEQIKNSILEFGFNDPVAIWGENEVVEGHGRLIAALELGLESIPVIRLDDLTEEQRRAYALVHNKLTMNSGFDADLLEIELENITEIDMTELGFEVKQPSKDELYADGVKGILAERYIVPPFSVLNTRGGDWQKRKRYWLEITGDLSETRDGETGRFGDSVMKSINGGTSNFDPVLAETMYFWFCPAGGKILDPFGGEQTKEVVAGECGYKYTGVEIRPEQVAVNRNATEKYSKVKYVCGNSNEIEKLVKQHDFDMVLTSPPYYDLEVYSAEDMSALGSYEEFLEQYKNIFAQCFRMLKDESFFVIKVAEIRNKKTGEYRNFVADTINFLREIGFTYYNEIILENAVGTLALRATKNMKSRKIGKVHQNVLVFYKGDVTRIGNKFAPIEFPDEEYEYLSI